jgi:glutamate carboxypeptidase
MISAEAFDTNAILAEMLEWVSIESPTYDPSSVDRMEAFIAPRLEALGCTVETIKGTAGPYGERLGGMLRAKRPGKAGKPPILVIAHADTVHPVGTLAGPLKIRRDGDKQFGPAIYDMKGGTVMALSALRVLIAAGRLDSPVTIIINPDEEIGSPTSRALIEDEAKAHQYVLIPEPAKGPTGEVTTGRHAFQRFHFTTHGRPGHSGWTGKDGRSAVRIMAQLVEELEGQSNFDTGPTYAVSVFHGGQWVNCVPMTCTAQALCVARDMTTFDQITRTVMALEGVRNDVRIEVTRGPIRPLWTANAGTMDLYTRAKKHAAALGFDLPHGQHGGGSDGNFTGALGIATLDGLGLVGNGAHTHEEHILVSHIRPRATMFARLVAELAA